MESKNAYIPAISLDNAVPLKIIPKKNIETEMIDILVKPFLK